MTETTEQPLLVIARLTVKSSYQANTEWGADEDLFDTVQFWIAPDLVWRIRTYAADHDIHIHTIEGSGNPVPWIEQNVRQTYDDVLQDIVVISGRGEETERQAIERAFGELNLGGYMEWTGHGFAFWNPDGGEYRSRSRPQDEPSA